MSIEALNWSLKQVQDPTMQTSTRFVLVILANRADPEGICWPSLRYISSRTGLSERTIRDACKELEGRSLMIIEPQQRVDGGKTSNRYILRLEAPPPATIAGGGTGNHCPSPGNQFRGAPATIAGHETKERNKEPDKKNTGAVAPLKMLTDLGIDEQVAKDWLAVRKAKRAPLTASALKAIEDEARKAGITLPEAIKICAERSWQGFKAAWLAEPKGAMSSTMQGVHALQKMRENLK